MQSVKESAANIAASAKSGLDKTKAVVQEKVEKMTAHNPTEKQMATEKKEEMVHHAERTKLEAREQNAAAKHAPHSVGGPGPYSYSTTGATGQTTGGHQMSALPGHGTGQPLGQVVEGTVQSHSIGTVTGTGRPTTGHNMRASGGDGMGYGTGGGRCS